MLNQRTIVSTLVSLSAALWLAGCGAGSGQGLDANGQPLDDQGDQQQPQLAANLTSIQEQVFTPVCAVCHIGASAPQGLRLDTLNNSVTFLIDVPANEVPSLFRVASYDPENSYLIQKLEGTAAVGGQMPLGRPPLPPSTIAVIRQWISDGVPIL